MIKCLLIFLLYFSPEKNEDEVSDCILQEKAYVQLIMIFSQQMTKNTIS